MAATYGFKLTATPPMREVTRRAHSASSKLGANFRDKLRTQGRRFVDLAKEESPGGATGTVAQGIFFRTFQKGRDIAELRVYPGRIGTWHLDGTGIYGPTGSVIRPVRAKALHFFIDGEELFASYVRGIKPNRFFGRAYRRWLPGARVILREVAEEWEREVSGGVSEIKL